MKKFLFLVFMLFGGYVFFIANAAAAEKCDVRDTSKACSVQDYKEKMCGPWKWITKQSFQNAAMGKMATPHQKVSEYFIGKWEKNLEHRGKIPFLSEPEKGYVRYLVKGIYAGKWKSADDVYQNCVREGDAFPQFLREELAEMKKHFLSHGTTRAGL